MSSSDDTLLQQNPTTRHVLPKQRAYYSSSDDSAAPTTPTRRSSDRVQVTRSRVSSPSSSEEEGACKRHEEEHRERRVKRSQEKSSNRRKHARSSSFVFDHPLVHHARTSSYAMYQQSVDIARNTISELDLPASSWCGFFAAAMLAVTLGEVVKINNAQTNPYMDEVFHVRQAQHFCAGNWTVWDSKITTLPGLYLLNAVIAHCAGFMTGKPNIEYCSLEKLRFVNIVMSVLIFVVMYTIFRKLSRRLKDDPGLGIQPIHRTCCMMNSLVLTCFPLLYFYNLLYYTDVGSVLFVLASYSCSIRNHHLKSAMGHRKSRITRALR